MAHISPRTGRSPDDVENDVVDILDDEPVLALPVSRELLVRLTGKKLGLRLQLPDAPVRRQWFIGLVGECRRHQDGLAALASAVSAMDHGGRASSVLEALAREYADVAGENASHSVRAGLPHNAGGGSDSSGGGEGGLARPHEPERLRLSQAELGMLAQVFHRMTAARQLLAAAGLAPERQPSSSGMTPAEFWGEVDRLLAAGALHGGRRRVLAAAAALYPANPVFTNQSA